MRTVDQRRVRELKIVSGAALVLVVACSGRSRTVGDDDDSAGSPASGGVTQGAGGSSGHGGKGGAGSPSVGVGGALDGGSAGRGGTTAGTTPVGTGGAEAGAGGAVVDAGGAPGSGGGPPEAGQGGVVAGNAGEGGAGGSPALGALTGYYDVYFPEQPPLVDGCEPSFVGSRLNLSIDTSGEEPVAMAFQDFGYLPFAVTAVELSQTTFTLLARDVSGPLLYDSPRLELGFDAEGLTGTGVATIAYDCGALPSTERELSVRVEADTTAPRLRVDPVLGAENGPVFSFTEFVQIYSEPVTQPNGRFATTFDDLETAAATVGLFDPGHPLPGSETALVTEWLWALGGPLAQERFVDPGSTIGHYAVPYIIQNVSDSAGNLASTDPRGLTVIAAAPFPVDFDTQDGTGSYGGAVYYPPGAPDSPCESGGCVAIEAPGNDCWETGARANSGLGVYLPNEIVDYVIRLRAWTTEAASANIQILYASGCVGELSVASTDALAMPSGEYTHASAWTDQVFSLCAGPDRDRGVILVPGCEPAPGMPEKPRQRLVLERVERSE